MDDANQPTEFSESGDPIYRYKEVKKPFSLAIGDEQHIKAVSDHIEKYIGKPAWVFHEIISDLVHVDVHVVSPRPDRNFHTLITTGMSQRAMKTPNGAEEWAYAELLLCLPPEWPLKDEAFKDENNYWPMRLLKFMARFPHQYDTWLSLFHSIPNGNPPAPMANTQFVGAVLGPPALAPEEFWRLRFHPEVTINFFAVVPLYSEEMDFKLKNGANELFTRFDKEKITELIKINRKNVAKKRFGLF
jgi:hypothetical protein